MEKINFHRGLHGPRPIAADPRHLGRPTISTAMRATPSDPLFPASSANSLQSVSFSLHPRCCSSSTRASRAPPHPHCPFRLRARVGRGARPTPSFRRSAYAPIPLHAAHDAQAASRRAVARRDRRAPRRLRAAAERGRRPLRRGPAMDRRAIRLVLRARDHDLPDLPRADRREPLRQHQARPRRRGAGIQLRVVDRDAVRGRHGHRPHVLRRRRADPALPVAADGRGRHARRRARGDADVVLPLGPARMGDLRRDGSRARVLRLSLQPAAHAALGPLSGAARRRERLDRAHGRRVRARRHGGRDRGDARLRRAATERGPAHDRRLANRYRYVPHRPRRGGRRARRTLRRERARQGRAPAVRAQSDARVRVARVRRRRGADVVPAARDRRQHRRISVEARVAIVSHVRIRSAERQRLVRRLDAALLGVVGVVVAVRRDVHRPDLARPHDPPVRDRRAARAHRVQSRLDDRVRQQRDLARHARGRGRARANGDQRRRAAVSLLRLPAAHATAVGRGDRADRGVLRHVGRFGRVRDRRDRHARRAAIARGSGSSGRPCSA